MLDSGLTFTPIQMDNDGAQLNETCAAINEQICRRLPRAGLEDRRLMESQLLATWKRRAGRMSPTTLDPLFANWEEALRRDLLTSRQFGSYTMQFDRQALVRNDMHRRSTHRCRAGIQNGYLSQNEARKALGLNPIPDGDTYMVNTALQPSRRRRPMSPDEQ